MGKRNARGVIRVEDGRNPEDEEPQARKPGGQQPLATTFGLLQTNRQRRRRLPFGRTAPEVIHNSFSSDVDHFWSVRQPQINS